MGREILTLAPPPADARLPYGPDPRQFGDLRVPRGAGPHPVVVYLHGGCWRSEFDLAHAGHACAALTEAGFATWSLEYRRIGAGGGWPATFLDVARGADHVRALAREHELDVERVVAAGHSAGGQLALWLAARRRIRAGDALHGPDPLRVRGALSIAGLVDLRWSAELGLCGGAVPLVLGGGPDELPERYDSVSPYELLPLGIPQVLVAAGRDDVVPLALAERYRDRAAERGDRIDLRVVAGADHFDPIDPRSAAFTAVRDAIATLS